jgi:hypothetical protein
MSFEDIQQSIIDKLKALGDAQKFDVYEVDIPVGSDRPDVEHAVVPYILIDFGGKGQQSAYNQGITGTRNDMKWTSVVMEAVANDPGIIRKLMGIIRDNFEGYIADPTWGEFIERVSSPVYSPVRPQGGQFYPPRYARTITYVVDVDA